MNYVERLKGLSEAERENQIETNILQHQNALMDADPVPSEVASSNADGWAVDEVVIGKPDLSKPNQVSIPIEFSLSGKQREDSPFSGDTITGTAVAVIDSEGEVQFTEVQAERDLGEDEE